MVVCHVVHDEYSGDRVSSCTLRVQLSCVMLYTASIGMCVVCHVVHHEYNGGRVSCCTRRVYWSCVMFYTTNIVVVVCHVVHD